ncbi:MAG: ABC transporter substrate-binding protein [Caldilineaceae bacterium]
MAQETQAPQLTPNPPAVSRRQFMQITAGATLAALLAACAPPGVQPQTGSQPAAAESKPAAAQSSSSGATLVWLSHQEIAGLGPNDLGATMQALMINAIHNSLVGWDTDNKMYNDLTESVDVQPDGLKYTFKLHKGVKFHDGSEFKAGDVKYTIDYYRDPKNATTIQTSYVGIDKVETPDDYTVVVNMATVNADSLVNWAALPIVHAKHHKEVGDAKYSTSPIGTGPFKLKEWKASEYTLLEAFPDYFKAKPQVDFIRMEVVPEDAVRKTALETGDADSSAWPLLVQDSLELKKDTKFKVYGTPGDSIKHFPLNNERPFFADKRCRQAMMYALDRQRIIDDLWNGAAQVAHSNLTPVSPYYKADLKRYDFNPEKAKSLLDEAGWKVGADGIREKDSVKFSFTCTAKAGDQARKAIAELAQQLFKDVGIEMKISEAPVAEILQGMREGKLDCAIFNWNYGYVLTPDPSDTLKSDGGNNFAHFKNKEMDEMISKGLQVVDPAKRKPYYDRIQEMFVEEVPVLYLQFDTWMLPFSTKVEGGPDSTQNTYPLYSYLLPLKKQQG